MGIRLSGSNEEFSAALVLVLAGIVCLWLGGSRLVESRASVRWPCTEGQVIRSEIYTTSGGRHGGTIYHFRIRYEYNVNSACYEADRISFDPQVDVNDPGPARALAARYPLGSAVRVYYDPARPGECVLQPGMVLSGLPLALFGLLLLAAGGAMLALWFNAESPRRAAPSPFASRPEFWPDAFVK